MMSAVVGVLAAAPLPSVRCWAPLCRPLLVQTECTKPAARAFHSNMSVSAASLFRQLCFRDIVHVAAKCKRLLRGDKGGRAEELRKLKAAQLPTKHQTAALRALRVVCVATVLAVAAGVWVWAGSVPKVLQGRTQQTDLCRDPGTVAQVVCSRSRARIQRSSKRGGKSTETERL
jgi:hypothetical protein